MIAGDQEMKSTSERWSGAGMITAITTPSHFATPQFVLRSKIKKKGGREKDWGSTILNCAVCINIRSSPDRRLRQQLTPRERGVRLVLCFQPRRFQLLDQEEFHSYLTVLRPFGVTDRPVSHKIRMNKKASSLSVTLGCLQGCSCMERTGL